MLWTLEGWSETWAGVWGGSELVLWSPIKNGTPALFQVTSYVFLVSENGMVGQKYECFHRSHSTVQTMELRNQKFFWLGLFGGADFLDVGLFELGWWLGLL